MECFLNIYDFAYVGQDTANNGLKIFKRIPTRFNSKCN